MPRNNANRRRGSGGSRRKGPARRLSGDLRVAEEGRNWNAHETVRTERRRAGAREEGGRPENNAEVRRLTAEKAELVAEVEKKDRRICMLEEAMICLMSKKMHEAYRENLEALERPEDATYDWKEDAVVDAKHEAITAMVGQMIHKTHPGPERKRQPTREAVVAFKDIVGFGEYQYEDMAFDEKDDLNAGDWNLIHYRAYLEARSLDWRAALAEQRGLHDYGRFVRDGSRDYLLERDILAGNPVPAARAGYDIPEFP